MPVHDRTGYAPAGDFRNQIARGSRGGPPVWWMRKAQGMSSCRCGEVGRANCQKHAAADQLKYRLRGQTTPAERANGIENGPEFEVFGRFPRGWLRHVLKSRLLGDVKRDEILHVCSGTLATSERWTVDIRVEARPTVVADGRQLPFRDGAFKAVLLDPPYTEEYARNLYGLKYPRASHLLREAARVTKPDGRIGILHIFVPFAPPGCSLVDVYGVTTGVGYRMRAFTVWQKSQASLLEGSA